MPSWTEEQQTAIDKENTNIIVSAGAGSGKTAVLTARVTRKLLSGVNINELLILTFTKKAAFEMKERIRKSILKNESIKNQLDYIDSSYITTFDSFALSIVKKYHYLLNVNKNVSIADSSIVFLKKKKILDDIFDKLYKEEDSDFLKLIDCFAIKNDKDIKKYILDINDKLDLKYYKDEYLSNYLNNCYSDEYINNLINDYNDLLVSKINTIKNNLDVLSNYVDTDYYLSLCDLFSDLFESKDYDSIKLNSVIKLPIIPRNSGEDGKKYKEILKKSIDDLFSYLNYENTVELISTYKSTACYVNAIIKIINMLDSEVLEFKNSNNIYEFTDIAKMAIRVLKENDEVKEELKNYFNEIMIDEYQDTSDLQEELISMINNNNVYMVGDIKQSIYRFRNANPYLFKSKYDNYSKNINGFKIDLTKNFRSREEVVNNVNLIFSSIMSDELGGASYKISHKMVFGNKKYIEIGNTSQNNNLEIHNYLYDKACGFSKEEIEIFYIANDIKNKVENKYKIFDKDEEVIRDCSYSDFAILLDKSLYFDLYKKIFEYLGIPLTKYTTTNITNEIEVLLIKNILKLIICVHDKVFDTEFKYAFTSVGRSYLFEYSDSDIFEYLKNGNYFDSSLIKITKEISDNLDSISLSDLIVQIIDKYELYIKQIKIGDVKNRINRLSSITDIFINLGSTSYNIYDVYDYFDNLIEEEYKLEVKEIEDSDNSVKIMTIHASKGLEFPICYFASLHSGFNIRELNERFLYNNKYGLITPYYKDGIGKLFVKNLVKSNYLNEEISEKIRLFYVALTRAKEKMIMVTSFNEKREDIELCNSRSFLDMLTYIKDDLKCYMDTFDINKLNITKDYNSIKKNNYSKNIDKEKDKIKINEISISNNFINKKHISKENSSLIDKELNDKLKFGERMHKVLESINFMNACIDNLDISEYYKEKINHLLELVNSSKIINCFKEYEFIYLEDGNYEHGIIDLMLEYNDEIKIIDYKLKNINDDNYYKQVNAYREYIEKISNKPIKIYLFSIVNGELMEVQN